MALIILIALIVIGFLFDTHFPGIEGIVIFLTKPLIWLNELLRPILDQIPDSPFIPLAFVGLLTLLFVLMGTSHHAATAKAFDYFIKRTLSWSCAAFLLGMIFASGNYGSAASSLMCYTRFNATLYNISEWLGIQQVILLWTLLGTLLLSLYYLITKGIVSMIRAWIGSALCVALGYVYMQFQFWFLHNVFGGLMTIIFIAIEVILGLGMFFGFIIMLLPDEAVETLNEISREQQRNAPSSSNSSTISVKLRKVPSYVTDDSGNSYPARLDGDFLYIDANGERFSKEWKDISESEYFYIDGTRFYLHCIEEMDN